MVVLFNFTHMNENSGDSLIINEEKVDKKKRDFIHIMSTAMIGGGALVALSPLLSSLKPSAEILALSSIEVSLKDIMIGQAITVMWRGKPIFIRHRTEQEIAEAESVDHTKFRDPESDVQRVKENKKQWLIMIGICTHLGCIPLDRQGDYNGWFCPCHGSHYDSSGRIRQGPAPLNLQIPPYEFIDEHLISIG